MAGSDIDPQSRDMLVRTVLGEANGQPFPGQVGVAAVVLNRLKNGGYGDSVPDVVLAPKQFEPWNTRRGELLGYSPDTTPGWGSAAKAVDLALAGEDPTNGATHFANVKTVQDRGNSSAMGWLSKMQNVTQIGAHTFGNADAGRRGTTTPMDDNPFLAGVKPIDPWTDLNTGVATRADGASIGGAAPTMSPDDVFKELTARAGANKTRPASTTPSTPTTTPEQTVAAAGSPAGPQAGMPPAGDASAAIGGGIIGGIPVVGAPLREGVVRAAAGIRSLQNGTPYADELAKVQAWDKGTQEQHPVATGIGNAAGAVVGSAPLMMAAPAAFGLGEGAMLGRTAASALSGAVLGGADAASRSAVSTGSVVPSDIVKGAAVGGAFGAAGPVGGQLIGMGANRLYDAGSNLLLSKTTGLSTGARNALTGALAQDGPAAIRAELGPLGSQGMLADTGSAVQGLAQGVAVKPGGSDLIKAIEARSAGAQQRVRDAVSQLGPAEDAQTVKDTIMSTRKALDSVNYPAALENAPPVDVKPIVQKIDSLLKTAEGKQKTALESLRSNLVDAPAQPSVPGGPTGLLDASGTPIMSPGKAAVPEAYKDAAQNLHNIKGELDSVINYGAPGLGVEAGAVNRQQGSLKAVRGALNDALESQVPGYASANKASSALAKRAEAVEDGYKGTLSGSATQDGQALATPERFQAEFSNKPLGEQVAQAKGLLARINQMVGVNRNDLGAMRNALQGEEGWNTGKMATVLGDEPVNRLVGTVNREATFGQTNNAVVGNAQSAFRTESAKALDKANPAPIDLSGITMTGATAMAGRKAYTTVLNLLTKTDSTGVEKELARVLSAQGPERDKFINLLTQAARVKAPSAAIQRGVERGGNMLIQSGQEPYRLAR